MANVHLPKGTRDFLPAQMIPRLRIIDTLRGVFSKYGFDPLETPAMERIETLMGKYGEEGDRLIFKILRRGEGGERGEVDQALRYDLTVPFARVIAMNPDLPMPFKRHQIQPVWRADRPQKGRFREFWQCDVDVVGAESLVADAEVLACFSEAYEALGFSVFTIRLNHRALLRALAGAIDALDREASLLIALDKLDKIGRGGVEAELLGRGFSQGQLDRVWELLDPAAVIPGAEQAEADLDRILELTAALGVPEGRIVRDRTLARGLDYYTGAVFEAEVVEPKIGSIGSGGRYDGLVGMFAGRSIPAVGASVGLDRIFVVMDELGMLGEAKSATRVYVTVFSDETRAASLRVAAAFRAAGVPTEVHLGGGRIGKQLKAADQRGAPFAVVAGPDDLAAGQVVLKDLRGGGQRPCTLEEAVAAVVAAP